ncbi:hypothetical protein [Thermus sediminis]|uniref:hypothetical protein n=1 Tax=Thermus sediminis TaxID=1761908 RepID=UPI001300362A|nr:hypothetical protein [Thermus sediminis]
MLLLDRTEWEVGGTPINLPVLSFPLNGNSNTKERIAFLERLMALLEVHFPHLPVAGLSAD